MDVIIRTDASVAIGTGHVMRCLTIARLLRSNGCHVTFLMYFMPGHLIEHVESCGFQVIQEMQEADVCIVDHYGIDKVWESAIRPHVRKVVVVDDLANRQHDCDLLLDPNMLPDFTNRYRYLIPTHCVQLLGPSYLILRDEFLLERIKVQSRSRVVQRLLVFMGGSDPTNETLKVLHALQRAGQIFSHVDVVVGSSNSQKSVIKGICRREGYHFYCQIDYLASLMGKADFSIGAGGSTTWERCYVGLPSASTIVAENQQVATETAADLGAVWNMGWHEEVTEQAYEELILSLPTKEQELKQMRMNGLALTESEKPNPWLQFILGLV